MAKSDQGLKEGGAKLTPSGASTAKRPAEEEQGKYGSGGSYGVGGGFDDEGGRDSTPEAADERAARAARSEAQQDGQQAEGFEREVDLDAAPRAPRHEAARSPEQEQLAAKNRRGSRI